MIKILVDTREQTPFQFREAKLSRMTLSEGDYALKGDKFGMIIERKSLEDVFGTVAKDHERFDRELRRLEAYAYPVVIVEALPSRIKFGAKFSGANGARVLDHLLALCVKRHVPVVFCDGRIEAQDMAWRLLKARALAKGKKI